MHTDIEVHAFRVHVVLRQVVDIMVMLPGTSALAAQDSVTKALAVENNNLALLERHFGEHLTWHPPVMKVVSAEHSAEQCPHCATTHETST